MLCFQSAASPWHLRSMTANGSDSTAPLGSSERSK
jgi:hypothetical protein